MLMFLFFKVAFESVQFKCVVSKFVLLSQCIIFEEKLFLLTSVVCICSIIGDGHLFVSGFP